MNYRFMELISMLVLCAILGVRDMDKMSNGACGSMGYRFLY